MLEGSEEKIICHTSAKKKKERKDSFTPDNRFKHFFFD